MRAPGVRLKTPRLFFPELRYANRVTRAQATGALRNKASIPRRFTHSFQRKTLGASRQGGTPPDKQLIAATINEAVRSKANRLGLRSSIFGRLPRIMPRSGAISPVRSH